MEARYASQRARFGPPTLPGEHYYRQLDDLALNLCIASKIANEDWHEYLEEVLSIARELGHTPVVGIVAFRDDAYPNAVQRRLSADFLERENVPPMRRIAMLTDSAALRGAMTAFTWVMARANMRAFASSEVQPALDWLAEVATFDRGHARAIWKQAERRLGGAP
jgi:hypothetical protein